MLKLSLALLALRTAPAYCFRSHRIVIGRPALRYYSDMTDIPKRTNADKKKPIHEPCEYEIETGDRYVRYVKPYFQDFRTFAKGRWLGRELQEVFSTEFGAHPPSYWTNALRNGQIRVNNSIMKPGYRIANGDMILHRTHRHEPPVFGEIVLVGESDDIVAISKPPSLPMHPCGAYRHNSLEYILKREHLIKDQPTLSIVHRLDRVTSGLVVLARSKPAATKISEEIRDKATTKVYLARVKGQFPTSPSQVPYLRALEEIDLQDFADKTEDFEMNGSTVDMTLPPAKRPVGETAENQEGQEGQEGQEAASAEGEAGDAPPPGKKGRKQKKELNPRKNAFGRGEDVKLEDLPPRLRAVKSREEVGQAPNVGVVFADPVADSLEAEGKKSATVVRQSLRAVLGEQGPAEGGAEEGESQTSDGPSDVEVWVKCPLFVVSPRDGVHACDPKGKPSLSIFRSLGYCAETDTSLVECRPYTGRTHQLRLHLQLLGTPIANDPCYGGVLFYGDPERRQRAVTAVLEMRSKGIIPMSKVPHFGDPAVDDLLLTQKAPTSADAPSSRPPSPGMEDVVQEPQPGESEDAYLIRTCRYCQENCSTQLEHLLHCDGIWLHALRYTGPPVPVPTGERGQDSTAPPEAGTADDSAKVGDSGSSGSTVAGAGLQPQSKPRWSFQAPYPAWAAPFGFVNSKD